MGLIPATGTEIAMGKVYRAFGLTAAYPPAGGTDIGLNNDLGAIDNHLKQQELQHNKLQYQEVMKRVYLKILED